MKKDLTRIYDKNKVNSRKKYGVIIFIIIILQIALYLGAFSKAEKVEPIKYINYYTLENFESTIAIENDSNGEFLILPEVVNEKNVVKYYIEKILDEKSELLIYNPNDKYYVEDEEKLLFKVEYEESVENLNDETSKENPIENSHENQEMQSNNEKQLLEENLDLSNSIEEPSDEIEEIIDTIYLGECGQEGEEGTELNPYKSIEMAFEALPETGGTIIIRGNAKIDSWASSKVALNKNVTIKGYDSESQITMEGNLNLCGDTTITDVKIKMSEELQNLAIYANGYTLILGEQGKEESLKIIAKEQFYPHVYGGSSTSNITGNTNVTIHSGSYQYIYGGSNNKNITGNTNLNITYAIVYSAAYGGSSNGTITGSTNFNISNGGKYGVASKGINEITLSGGSKSGSITQNTQLNIDKVMILNGCIVGAGNSSVSGSINLNIKDMKLGEEGNGTNSIYGAGYTGASSGATNVNINIDGITGNPQYIIGYAYSNGGNAKGTIKMELKNINGSNTEIYGGSYSGTQTKDVESRIITSDVIAKILSPGGIDEQSIKSYNVTINGGCSFSQGIYAGISTNSKSNVVTTSNTLNFNNYGSNTSFKKLYFNNKNANINLNNSYITTGSKFYYANLNLINSKLEIQSINNTGWSLGNIAIDKNSELSIVETKNLLFAGNLSGSGTLKLKDTTLLYINGNVTGNIQVDIIEDKNITNHYINIITTRRINQENIYFTKTKTQYQTDFVTSTISYWKFYTNNNKIESKADCVYLDCDYGNDNNTGQISSPIKTIEKASQIIKSDSNKKKVVILSHLDLNRETKKVTDKSNIYTAITATDGNINFQKYVNLNATTRINNIYQNLEFVNIQIKSSSGVQNIFLNGNKLRINTGVTTNSNNTSSTEIINIYGGSDSDTLKEVETSIEIKSGTWNSIYGGSNSGTIEGNTNITITGGTISNTIYGGSNSGIIEGNTNITITGGTIKSTIYGGSNSGSIDGNTNLTITGGTISNAIYGGSNSATITKDIYVNIKGGTISNNIYGGNNGTSSASGKVEGTINLNISAGTFNSSSTNIYAGGKYGTVNNIVTNISKMTFNNAIKIYGGGENTTITGNINLDVTENTNFSTNVTFFGGNKAGIVKGNINLKLANVTFGAGSTVYRGNDSAELLGTINSTFENVSFTSTNSYLYLGSNSGKINGSIDETLGIGMFKNNLCNAIVYGGSNSGNITGNVSLNIQGITFGNEVYCGTNTGTIDGNNITTINQSTFNSNLYGLGNLNTNQTTADIDTNKVIINDSTIKGTIFVVKSTGNRVLEDIEAEIENVTFKDLYAFKSYNAISKKININITNSRSNASNGKIDIGTVQSNTNLDLTKVLTISLNNNTPQFNFSKNTNIENLNIIGSNVITNGILKTVNLTLKSNSILDLEKQATVTNSFFGDTEQKYGEIYVYDGLNIGVASGKTILKIGTIIGDISSPELSFVKEGAFNTNVSTPDTANGTRKWTVGYLNYLDVVYVDEIKGNDEINIGETPDTALASLKIAYYYCREGGTIVICGPTTMNVWPTHSAKKMTITSKYAGVDYRNTNSAKLTLNAADNISSVNLQAETNMEYLTLVMSKTQNIYANGNKLTLGVEGDTTSLKVTNTNGATTTAYLNIYGGTYNSSVLNTNLIINSGAYKSIYAGGTNGNYQIGNNNTRGTVVSTIKITGGEFGNSTSNQTIIAGNYTSSNGFVNGGINIDITNAKITGNILSSGYAATTYGDVKVNINKNVTINGNLFTDQYNGNIDSKYKYILNIDGTGGTTSINNIFYGSYNKYHSSTNYETNITNATIGDIYYGSYNNSGTTDEVKGKINLNINQGAKISNIYAGRYSADTTEAGKFYIIINANEPLKTNIYRNSKNGGGRASICEILFNAKDIEYLGNIENATKINIQNESNIRFKAQKLGTSNLSIIDSIVSVENTITSLSLGTVNINNQSTFKILNSLKTIKLTGNLIGGGNLYLNDAIRLEITGNVLNNTTIYCNDTTKYFNKGTIIIAQLAETTLENAFITPEGTNWKYKDNENKRIWQVNKFNINNIIYVNSSSGTNYGLGTVDMPVESLETAYKIANKRYAEVDIDNKYYIILQNTININKNITEGIKLNNDIEVVITNKIEGENINYSSAVLNINIGEFDFIGKTTIENLVINTRNYNESVEFFGNGYDITFGRGIVFNSIEEKYPIIYGGGNNNNIQTSEINLKVLSGKYNMIFGGGKEGTVNANINLTIGENAQDIIDVKQFGSDNDGNTGIFGAGRSGNVQGNIVLNINSGEFFRIYGAGLTGTTIGNVTINFKGGNTNRLYGGGQRGPLKGNKQSNTGNVIINIGNDSSTATVANFLRGSGQYQGVEGSTNLNIYDGTKLLQTTQVAAGGYQGNVETSNLNIYGGTIQCDVYGGGWGIIGDPSKGLAGNTNVHIYNNAIVEGDIYGGGFAGTANNTNVIIEQATINNVYGGGNEAKIQENTNVRITSSKIMQSAYGGGKGATATVVGNSSIIIDGTTIIEGSLFGGGNAAMTGIADTNSESNVYIVGGTVKEDVYGGANTSIVYGNTNIKIGKEAVLNDDLLPSPIEIKGTVFGGGKSNTVGSEDYDFTFESVTGNVYIDIDQKDTSINIEKSIFASGNAAKISGKGYIKISNYGTTTQPENLVSIQRATEVVLNNSSLWISGTTDRTNAISTAIYTINRVNDLKLKDSSTLYLSSGVNILENLYSLSKEDELEFVKIENGKLEQNTNNKIYLLHGKNMELSAEDGGNGSVYGMMFLGKFDGEPNVGKIETGIYSTDYVQGETVKNEDIDALYKNSYLQAQHYQDHNIQKDGFYTNVINEENIINIEYITPTPEDATYYQWIIGKISENIYYEDIELVASKYSSTAQITLDLVGLNAPDMILEVEHIDTTLLKEGVKLRNELEIPNMAENADEANSIFGLTMLNGQQGWKAKGATYYLLEDNTPQIEGTTTYYADKSNTTPTLTFNFAHSKNVSENIDLGKVSIRLNATYKENEELISKNVTIEIKLRVNDISSTIDYYEGAITPGFKYAVFPNATTNITSKSSLSTYYSIYLNNYDTSKYYENYEGYYHRVTSSFVLPKGTKLIMIDKSNNDDKYYYYIVTKEDEETGKKSYNFTDFVLMGTLDEYYNNDSSYYNKEKNYVIEEFVFQIDFENTQITQNYLRQTLKIELMDKTDDSIRLTVNDAIYPMMYNVYHDQEVEKTMNIDQIGVHLYEPENLDFTINTNYIYKIVNSNVVYDTTNFDNAEGIKITFFLGTEQLTKEELGGISVACNGSEYFVRDDGSISFKIADIVSNLETKIKVNLMQKENWIPGTYTMKIEAIASTDGVNASNSIASGNVTITFSNNEYGLDVFLDDDSQIINKLTGKSLNNNNILNFDIEYATGLENPNIRIALYRRDYTNIYTPKYNLVDLADYVSNALVKTNKENEYLVTDSPIDNQQYTLNLKENLKTGTYKIKFLVYDGENYIGEVYKMIIIKEEL